MKAIEENVLFNEQIIEKQVKTFLDLVILAMLKERSMHGYKIIAIIHREFGILLSPASLYPQLHYLEENRLLEPYSKEGKVIYSLTPKGKEILEKKINAYNLSMKIMTKFIKTSEDLDFFSPQKGVLMNGR